jgi:RNA:NAD 2'-phosphotransferase (TPT1/KptA family)
MSKRTITISKFMSKYLRHEPEALGLTLESGGWVLIAELLDGAAKHGFPITREELLQVVQENDKQRFAIDESVTKIRANQGHSTSVDLQLKEVEPPSQLFHGTVAKFLDAILSEGLKKMNRHQPWNHSYKHRDTGFMGIGHGVLFCSRSGLRLRLWNCFRVRGEFIVADAISRNRSVYQGPLFRPREV